MSGYFEYSTEAIVISTAKVREADSYCILFTRELGLLSTTITGVRTMRSKLRYGLTRYSRSRVTLVRGKGGWRVTNCYPLESLYAIFRDQPAARATLGRVMALCARLLDEGKGYEELYDTVVAGFSFMREVQGAGNEIPGIERMIVLRVLYMLGYVQSTAVLSPFLQSNDWDAAYLETIRPVMKTVTREINHSLLKSGL